MNRRGFTLIDSMIGLCLTLLIFVSSLQFFGVGRRIFFKLRAAQEERLNVLAALEKIRLDTGRAGCGLQTPIKLGLAVGLEVQDGVLTLQSEGLSLTLEQDLAVGQTRVSCRSTEDVTKSRTVCFFDETTGERHSLAAVGRGFILLSGPLEHSYKKEETKVVVLDIVSYFFDPAGRTVRRKANASSAQPLLEEVAAWDVRRSEERLLITVSLKLGAKEKRHEMSFLPKNIALVGGL